MYELTADEIEQLRSYDVDYFLYTLTQDELREHIKYLLDNSSIPYQEINGNIVSIRFKDKPVFCAHMDTVNDKDMCTPLSLNGVCFYRKGRRILGADDRSGVNMILNHMENINFIFTRDEEIGHVGMKALDKDDGSIEDPSFRQMMEENCNFMVVVDRRNAEDLISYENRYCSTDLVSAIEEKTFLKMTRGFSCDADVICRWFPCVNISSAYYNPHSVEQFLNIVEFKKLNDIIEILNSIEGKFRVYGKNEDIEVAKERAASQDSYAQYLSDSEPQKNKGVRLVEDDTFKTLKKEEGLFRRVVSKIFKRKKEN